VQEHVDARRFGFLGQTGERCTRCQLRELFAGTCDPELLAIRDVECVLG
jgi:hypothetical protein